MEVITTEAVAKVWAAASGPKGRSGVHWTLPDNVNG